MSRDPEPPLSPEERAILTDALRRQYIEVTGRLDEPKMGNPKYGMDRRAIESDLRRISLDAILLAEHSVHSLPVVVRALTADTLEAALTAIKRAESAVADLCSGRLRWEMRVPAEPDHDPDLIISDALGKAADALAALPVGDDAPSLDVERLAPR